MLSIAWPDGQRQEVKVGRIDTILTVQQPS
jgi:hypothetical protein